MGLFSPKVVKSTRGHGGALTAPSAGNRTGFSKCQAQPRGKGRLCNRPIRTGRLADGESCGRELCQLWFLSHDPDLF